MKDLLLQLISYGFRFVEILILAYCILSIVAVVQRPRPRWMYHPLIRWIEDVGFRILRPFRNLLDRVGLRTGPIDFSPIIALMVLDLLARLLFNLIGHLPIP